ncbi:MAG: flagellar assembly protein FliW [Candidatus Methylomirabilales bacterium]
MSGTTAEVRMVESRRFGCVPVAEENVLRFPEGLPGFEGLREFLLVAPAELAPVQFLVPLADPEISFPILPARLCLADYAPALGAAELDGLQTDRPADLALYAILTFDQAHEQVTANLRAPILLNPAARLGRQVILPDATYALRHALLAGGEAQG